MNISDLTYCAFHGHFVVGPTGETTTCLRCGKTLDGLGLDPALDRRDGATS